MKYLFIVFFILIIAWILPNIGMSKKNNNNLIEYFIDKENIVCLVTVKNYKNIEIIPYLHCEEIIEKMNKKEKEK